ncbi:MAG: adenine phosphoribosyltransferase [Clostridia bacterium]|nr:adenine phosphoribosyltransferase [Clostridia bacterium]
MEYFKINVAGVERDLPIVPISDKLSIAAFVIFGDTDIVEPCARALAEKLPPVDYLITAEAKSIPLIYEMAKVMKMPRYVIARKSVKGYMANPIITRVNSITTKNDQILCLDEEDVELIRGKRLAIIDDVISTGASLAAMEQLISEAGGEVVARAAILTEGDANDREDLIALGQIPLFFKE